jgi:hypothetical protein
METLTESIANISKEYEKRMNETINILSQFYPESMVVAVAMVKTPSILDSYYKEGIE